MNTGERAYERLVAANPMPDPEQYVASTVDIDATLPALERVMEDTKDHQSGTIGTAHLRRRRWQVAAAAFVAVLAVGGALAATTWLDDDTTFGAAPETPVEVVEAFFERWNSGNIEAVMAIIDPAAEINRGLQESADMRGLIDYSIPFNGTMEADCSAGPEPEHVTCEWAWVTDGTQALGLDAATGRSFTVIDARITALTTPNYGVFDRQLSRFAQERDPAGYTNSCSPDGIAAVGGDGFPFNARCGTFLADLESAFVSNLSN